MNMKNVLNFLVAIFWLLGVTSSLSLVCMVINWMLLIVAFPGESIWLLSPDAWLITTMLVLTLPLVSKSFREKGPRCLGRLGKQLVGIKV